MKKIENGKVVKDQFGRYYLVRDNWLVTPLGMKYMEVNQHNIDRLGLKLARKSWDKVCKDWKPSGKVFRSNKRNNPIKTGLN